MSEVIRRPDDGNVVSVICHEPLDHRCRLYADLATDCAYADVYQALERLGMLKGSSPGDVICARAREILQAGLYLL